MYVHVTLHSQPTCGIGIGYKCIVQFIAGGNIDGYDAKLAIRQIFPFNILQLHS